MQHSHNDIVIVGGGIGGSGLASVLATGGLEVTVLERTESFPDRVRGEVYAPWGARIADELGLLQPLLDAGAAFATDWVFYDAAIPTDVAESNAVELSEMITGVPGMMNFGHPRACQALFDHAADAGARMIRRVAEIDLDLTGPSPRIAWTLEDGTFESATPSLVVGADGRFSAVRKAAGVELHSAPVRQYITGLLIASEQPLAAHINSFGTADDVNWYSFPQGTHRCRVYLAHLDVHRYTGSTGTARFLADLRKCACPNVSALADGTPASPLATHPSVDTWTDEPFAPGVLLIGDAAGYNDPIIGQGLSLTLADIRDVSRVLLAGGRAPVDFVDYGVARSDRFAKLRLASQTIAEMMCSFGDGAAARRLRGLPLMGSDETVALLGAAMFAGPEVLPPGTELLEAARERFLAA